MVPLVSVIIPVFNRAGVLARAVDSVLEQEGVEYELLVVDDASNEPAEEVFRKVEQAGHRVLRLQSNGGPGRARNLGSREARGEWLAFLDSDDHWLPGKLCKHLAHLEESGLSIGQTDEIWYRNGERVNPPKLHRIGGGDLFRRSLKAVCVSSSTVVLKRELFHSMGGFDESMFVCEDYDLWLRAASRESFEHLQEPLVVKYGGHEDQLSRALPAMDRYRILSILKGLAQGWIESAERVESARLELTRKLRILGKGSVKHGREGAAQVCRDIAELLADSRFSEARELAESLTRQWATRPER